MEMTTQEHEECWKESTSMIEQEAGCQELCLQSGKPCKNGVTLVLAE